MATTFSKGMDFGASSQAEIIGADKKGIWVTLDGAPYFVAYEKTLWLRDPAVRSMLRLTMPNGFRLRWDSLDFDLDCTTG